MEDLRGKVVLITGAARGMGKLDAFNFAREGCTVVITDVDEAALRETARELEERGHKVHWFVHDVSDRKACFDLAEKVESEIGPVDVLINNAAIALNVEVLEASEEVFRRITEVNYLGQVWMMQAFVPRMVKRGRGHVVNMCSIAGKVAAPKLGPYSATKFALIGITDAIRQELHGTGVNFTIVNPGYVATGMFEGAKVPFITGWVDPQKVSDAIVEAVKKNKGEIFVPNFVNRLTTLLRALGFPKFLDFMFRVVGASKSFETMRRNRGRPF